MQVTAACYKISSIISSFHKQKLMQVCSLQSHLVTEHLTSGGNKLGDGVLDEIVSD